MGGGDDFTDRFAGHDLPNLDRHGVCLLLAQSAAHVGIDGEPDRAGYDLSGAGRGDGGFDDFEVGGDGFPARAAF